MMIFTTRFVLFAALLTAALMMATGCSQTASPNTERSFASTPNPAANKPANAPLNSTAANTTANTAVKTTTPATGMPAKTATVSKTKKLDKKAAKALNNAVVPNTKPLTPTNKTPAGKPATISNSKDPNLLPAIGAKPAKTAKKVIAPVAPVTTTTTATPETVNPSANPSTVKPPGTTTAPQEPNTSPAAKNIPSNTTPPATRTTATHTYLRGKEGGCYYINSKGHKEYVSRDKCPQ